MTNCHSKKQGNETKRSCALGYMRFGLKVLKRGHFCFHGLIYQNLSNCNFFSRNWLSKVLQTHHSSSHSFIFCARQKHTKSEKTYWKTEVMHFRLSLRTPATDFIRTSAKYPTDRLPFLLCSIFGLLDLKLETIFR